MAVSATSKALLGAAGYSTKWHQKRIHRKLDDRDDVMDEALEIIESYDPTVLPLIEKIVGISGSKGATMGGVTFHIGGVGCTSASTITLAVGGTSIALDTPGADTVAVSSAGLTALNALIDAGTTTTGSILAVYLRVDNVLCPPFTFTVVS